MKSRTRKLAWLLSATMVITSVNPGMMAMASEETDVIEQMVEETTDPVVEEEAVPVEEYLEEAEVSEDEEIEEEITIAEPEEEQILMAGEQLGEEIAVYADGTQAELSEVEKMESVIKGTWDKTGTVTIQTDENEETSWYKFVVPEDGKYKVLQGNPEIYKLYKESEGDAEELIPAGDNDCIKAKKGEIYYFGFSGCNDDGQYTWETELKKMTEIANISNVQIFRTELVAEKEDLGIEGTKITLQYEDNTAETLEFEDTNWVEDSNGNYVKACFSKDGEDIDEDNDPETGEYDLYFTIDGQKYTSDDWKITYTDIEHATFVDEKQLKVGENKNISSSKYWSMYDWYTFKPEQTGRYYFSGADDADLYVWQKIDGTLMKIAYSSNVFKAEKGITYYVAIQGAFNEYYEDKAEDIYEQDVTLVFSENVTGIKIQPTKTEFYERVYEPHVVGTAEVTYASGEPGTIELKNEYRTDWVDDEQIDYVTDQYNNRYWVRLQKKDTGEWFLAHSRLEAGTYIVHMQLTDDTSIDAEPYEITIKNWPTPVTDPTIPVTAMGLGKNYNVEVNEKNNSAWFKYTPQADMTVRYQARSTETDSEYDTVGEIYDESGIRVSEGDDTDDSMNFMVEYKLGAGRTYYFKARLYEIFETGKFLVSLNIVDHSHAYTEERKEATCTAAGYTQQKCNVCGEVKAGSYAVIPAKGHSFGNYQITTQPTVLAEGVQTRTCTVCGYTENAAAGKLAANVTLSSSTLPLQVKQSVSLAKLIIAMTTGDRLVSCTTSNKKIATVNNAGKVTGKKAGKAKITMNFASGLSKTVTVKVQKAKVATSKITNVPGKITLKVKKTYKLSPVIAPITTKDKASYKSANKKVATVAKNGKITAKKAGKTTITVKVGKKTKKVKVTITK